MTKTKKPVSAAALHKAWKKDPAYSKAYGALSKEFELASAFIEARSRAGLTQQELAKRMGTTQTVVARLEGGQTMPSTRTLERFAKATGHKLEIRFKPERAA